MTRIPYPVLPYVTGCCLVRLDLLDNTPNPRNAVAICRAILESVIVYVLLTPPHSAGRCLVRLDLSDNPLTEEVVPALAAALAAQPQLRALNLNDTSLGPDGVAQLCGALLQAATSGGQQVGAGGGVRG